jgi:hypothetical protein
MLPVSKCGNMVASSKPSARISPDPPTTPLASARPVSNHRARNAVKRLTLWREKRTSLATCEVRLDGAFCRGGTEAIHRAATTLGHVCDSRGSSLTETGNTVALSARPQQDAIGGSADHLAYVCLRPGQPKEASQAASGEESLDCFAYARNDAGDWMPVPSIRRDPRQGLG